MNDRFREMNDRIRELGEQSHLMGYMVHLYTVNAPDGYRQPLDVRKAAMEKFAELIILECANVIVTDTRLSDVRSATHSCARSIKEHFGINDE